MSYNYKHKKVIPVYDAYEDEERTTYGDEYGAGEFKEYHTTEIKAMRFGYFLTGFGVGGMSSGIAWALYYMV